MSDQNDSITSEEARRLREVEQIRTEHRNRLRELSAETDYYYQRIMQAFQLTRAQIDGLHPLRTIDLNADSTLFNVERLTEQLNDPTTPLIVPNDFTATPNESDGEVSFNSNRDGAQHEILRIAKDGFYIEGKKVVDDRKVYDAFIEWLNIVRTGENLPPIESVRKEEDKKEKSSYNRYIALTQDPEESK